MSAPYWEVITSDELRSMRLTVDFREWIKLTNQDKLNIQRSRDHIMRRMESSFVQPISLNSICIAHEQFLAFQAELKRVAIKEARFEVEANVHRLDKAPFLLCSSAGILTIILFFWLGSKDDSIWAIYASPLGGLFVGWHLFRTRQDIIRRRHRMAVEALENLQK